MCHHLVDEEELTEAEVEELHAEIEEEPEETEVPA